MEVYSCVVYLVLVQVAREGDELADIRLFNSEISKKNLLNFIKCKYLPVRIPKGTERESGNGTLQTATEGPMDGRTDVSEKNYPTHVVFTGSY